MKIEYHACHAMEYLKILFFHPPIYSIIDLGIKDMYLYRVDMQNTTFFSLKEDDKDNITHNEVIDNKGIE